MHAYHTCQVEDAQGNEAPIQRLADSIAGPFVYSIMTLSATTFAFWYVVVFLLSHISQLLGLNHIFIKFVKLIYIT